MILVSMQISEKWGTVSFIELIQYVSLINLTIHIANDSL